MANYASKLLKVALNEVGYLEKKTNENLYSKTANAGYNNYTKYANDFDKTYTTFYNGKKNGYAWCDMFVDWCFVKAFGEANARELLGQPKKSAGAGCQPSANYYKSVGRFYKTPKVGDQIFFKDSSGKACHTGIVYAVDTVYVYTVEGNTSSAAGVVANGGAVAKKKYTKVYSKIYGYGRPAYDAEPKQTVTSVSQPAKKEKFSAKVQAWQTAASRDGFKFPSGADGIWGKECETVAKAKAAQLSTGTKNNDLTKFVQKQVGVSVDGDFGPKTKAAVKKYQKKKKLTADGIVGYNTYKALCGVK